MCTVVFLRFRWKTVSGGFNWRVSSGPFNLFIKQFPTMKTLDPTDPAHPKKNSCSTKDLPDYSAPAQQVTSFRVLLAQALQQAAPRRSSPARPVWHRAFAFTSSCLTPRGLIQRTLVPSGNQTWPWIIPCKYGGFNGKIPYIKKKWRLPDFASKCAWTQEKM